VPLFHLLREESLAKAIAGYGDTEPIPRNNIALVESLGEDQIRQLFPYWDTRGRLTAGVFNIFQPLTNSTHKMCAKV